MPRKNRRTALAWLLLVAGCSVEPGPRPTQPDPTLVCAPAPIQITAEKSDKAKPAPDRGMGGTGIYAEKATPNPGERGSGGTGIVARVDDRGLGGTGIIGTVTGFGSICVNGFRVAYDDTTPLTIDGMDGAVSQLARGQTVMVDADAAMTARRIAVQSALVGPVTVAGQGGLAVMGQAIPLDPANSADEQSLAPGDLVAVSGLQRSDGSLVVTRVARAASDRALVRGYVTAVDQDTVTIGQVKVTPTNASDDLVMGAWAVARGQWDGAVLRTDQLSVGPEVPDGAQLSIEGFVEAKPDGRYVLRGVSIGPNAGVGLDRPTIARLSGATRVQMLGTFDRGQSLAPSTVVVPETFNPLGVVRPVPGGLQDLRGSYGRPLDPSLRPNWLPPRPAGAQRPTTIPPVERPPTPVRPPEAPPRPGAPTRPVRPGGG